jgi:thiol peroxidase
MTTERNNLVTFKAKPVTLVGNPVSVGQPAPDFKLTANDMSDATLAKYKGKVIILSSVPSLDTPVCDLQTKRFNDEAAKLGDKAVVLTASMDLPMAQRRWCGSTGAKNVVTLSDYKDRSLAAAYGLYIKELGLLTRAVFIIDTQGTIKYIQLVPEVTQEPDYDAVINAAKPLLM